jgi:two-component system, cell cycle sensor histidine kinase and response regulator CckA
VYGIVKMHHGHIEADSIPGKGTTFKIYLARVEDAPHLTLESVDGTALQSGKETVLIVEDEQMVRDISVNILEMLGYRVIKACNPQEALEGCEQLEEPVHLLLTDVVLPEMDGRSLFNRLTSRFPGMKVLYMSGYTNDAVVQHGVLEPGVLFLQKPFSPDRLARKVREALDQAESFSGTSPAAGNNQGEEPRQT